MSAGREIILRRVRDALGRGPLTPEEQLRLRARSAHPRRNQVPERGKVTGNALRDLFIQMAEKADATTALVPTMQAVPAAVVAYLQSRQLPPAINLAPHPDLQALDWQQLALWQGLPRPEDKVAVTPTFAGVAETGSLVVASGPRHPYSLNLLPDHHVAVLSVSRIRGCYEDSWDMIRTDHPDVPPRTVLWITGPSRTGDIEMTLQLGAHGPLHLHIILIDDQGIS